MLLRDFIRESSSSLSKAYPPKEAQAIVLRLCQDVLGVKSYTHVVEPSYEIPSESLPILERSMDRLLGGEPLQYVLGRAEFCGHVFTVTPDVLIPRPETEILVERAVAHIGKMNRNGIRVLDLCSGSGCIAWSVALACPGVKVVAVDISDKALKVASSQKFNRTETEGKFIPPEFVEADILGDVPFGKDDKFDVILSNPPYIRNSEKPLMDRNVLDYEPSEALFVSDEDPTVFYRAIARWSAILMKEGGLGISEINQELGDATADEFRSCFESVSILSDLSGRDRFVEYCGLLK